MVSSRDMKVGINPRVVAEPLKDGAVLIDADTGECFELNKVGAEIWGQMSADASVAQIVSDLVARYGLTEECAAQDVQTLRRQLAEHGLVQLSDPRVSEP